MRSTLYLQHVQEIYQIPAGSLLLMEHTQHLRFLGKWLGGDDLIAEWQLIGLFHFYLTREHSVHFS